MFYDTYQTCEPFCAAGYTTNGNQDKHCEKCDPSCASCAENGEVGDKAKCIDCAEDHPFRKSMTQTCLKECTLGLFQSTDSSCSECRDPCEGCTGTPTSCTSCHKDSSLAYLFESACISDCIPGYVSIDNVCTKCNAPCSTCQGTADTCVDCDGVDDKRFLYRDTCYSDCPAGSTKNLETLSCFACVDGCDLCDLNDANHCIKCSKPQLAYHGECIDACPDGYAPNEDKSACRPWQLSDLGILPYPFLIAAAIGIVICLFGLMRRRAYLRHGKMAWMSPQNTLTCIIVVIAPL
jgi:proprotein convertase subtilisin/kexin type 5